MADSIKLYEKEIKTLLSLPDEQQAHIMKALLAASVGEDIPELDPMENAVFGLVFDQTERAKDLSERRRNSVNKRYKGDTNAVEKGTDEVQTSASGVQNSTTDLQNSTTGLQKSTNEVQTSTNGVQNPTTDLQNPTTGLQKSTNEVQTSTNGVQNSTNSKNAVTKSYTNTSTNTITSTSTNTASSARAAPAKKDKAADESFDRFWAAYPNKKSKQDAEKAWRKIKPDDELVEKMLSALERQKNSVQWTKDGGQFIPYPATWLNGRRWEDETEPAPMLRNTGQRVYTDVDPDNPWN